ncbi:transposase [Pseudomonas sp. MDT1-17]
MRYIQGENRSQSALFPLSLDELIPDDHLVRVIEAYIALLDFEQLGFDKARPKATGRPSYDPADLLKLYLYGYFQRIRSSRRLEAECRRNVEVMWLLGRLAPDFKTIADFRRDNSAAFTATCRAFVRFCRQAGLIAGELVAIDGSKFQAVASSRKHLTLKQLNKGDRIYQATISDCGKCPLKSRCTKAKRRYLMRHAHEAAFERMEQRMKAHPEMMVYRRSIVEHPFGNLKHWIFGNGRFLLRQLKGTRAEMALAVQAYNLRRAIQVLGARKLIALMG